MEKLIKKSQNGDLNGKKPSDDSRASKNVALNSSRSNSNYPVGDPRQKKQLPAYLKK